MDTASEAAVVQRTDVEAAAKKLSTFVSELPPSQKEVLGWLLQRAGSLPALAPLPVHYKPRGAKHLMVGGADGLLVIISRSGIHVSPPQGPLPTDFVGIGVIPPQQ